MSEPLKYSLGKNGYEKNIASGVVFLLLTTVSCIPGIYSVIPKNTEPEKEVLTQITQDTYKSEMKETYSENGKISGKCSENKRR